MTPTDVALLDEWVKDEWVKGVRGISTKPMTREELVAEARSLIAPILGDATCLTLVDKIFALEEVKDIREIRPAPQGS